MKLLDDRHRPCPHLGDPGRKHVDWPDEYDHLAAKEWTTKILCDSCMGGGVVVRNVSDDEDDDLGESA